MSVIIHRNVVRLATFADWTFDWTDAHCNKSFAEAGEVVFTAKVAEAAVAMEQKGGQLGRCFAEALLLADAADKRMQKRERGGVCLAAAQHRTQEALCREAMRLKDTMQKNAVTALAEGYIFIADMSDKDISFWHNDAWRMLGKVARVVAYRRRPMEALLVESQSLKEAALLYWGRLGLRDFSNKGMRPLHREALGCEEMFRRSWILRRDVHTALKIAMAIKKRYVTYKTAHLAVYDAFLRACRSVLSNIGVTTKEMTFDDFMDAVSQPPNYDKFSDFNVGDYEYMQALVRFILISRAAQTEPMLYGLNVHVDIDDTNDRGIAEIKETAGATRVYFNKFYYHPPEVNVTLKGGNTASGWIVPWVLRTDGKDEYGRYFEVELRASGQRVTGSVSWTAKGY